MDARNERAPGERGAGAQRVPIEDAAQYTTVGDIHQLADRLDLGVPNELRLLKAWLLWKRDRDKRGEKFDKVPYYASGGKRFGTQGSPEDLARLVTFDVALARLREGGYDGLGLAMIGQGIVGLDFDGCRGEDGVIAQWVLDGTYAEISPSGSGVRAFYRGTFPDCKNHEARIETFCRSGFVTVTGERLNGCDLSELPAAVASELNRRLGPDKVRSDSAAVLSEACARDPVLARLKERGMVLRDMGGGKFNIKCPFEASHTTPGGSGDAVYFTAHTGGYASGNFDCKHAHCSQRSQAEFRTAIGLGARAKAESQHTGDSKGRGGERAEEWPEPEPLIGKVPSEPYPLDALPEIVRKAVTEVQGFVKAPMPLVASSALAAISIATQAHVDVRRAKKLEGPTSLYLLSIAASGERKTTCDSFFTRVIREHDAQEADKAKESIKEYDAKLRGWTAEREGIEAAIRTASRTGKEGTAIVLKRTLVELQKQKPEKPIAPQYLRMDDTPENLAWTLAREWPSVGIASSEGSVIFGAHAMSRDLMMRNLGLLNVLWDGGHFHVGRRTSESFSGRGARLTVSLQIQEAALRSFYDRSDGLARGTGFLARFLVSWPDSTQGFRLFAEAPEHWPALGAFNHRISRSLQAPIQFDDKGVLMPRMLSLTKEAKDAWVEFSNAIEGELRSGGELHDVRDVASKTADNAARLAALFQAFQDGADEVGLDAFAGAGRVVAWHLNESRRFFGELALPLELANAVRLDRWLVEHCRQNSVCCVGRRTAQQYGPLRDGAALNQALDQLVKLSRVRLKTEGKQVNVYVNPKLVGGGL